MADDKQQSSNRKRKNTWSSSSNSIGDEHDRLLQRLFSVPQHQDPPRLPLPLPIPQQVPLDLFPTLNPLSSSSSNNPNPNPNPNPSLIFHNPKPPQRQPKRRRPDKEAVVNSPWYPHVKEQPCTVHSLNYLLEKGIYTVSGEVKCGSCKQTYTVTYDVEEKFKDLSKFIRREKDKSLSGRVAPHTWLRPTVPGCEKCKLRCDIICIPRADLCEGIDWLFLLLGQLLGECYRKQLVYFCKTTKIGHHSDSAKKDELLYRVYFELCRQLQPEEELFKGD